MTFEEVQNWPDGVPIPLRGGGYIHKQFALDLFRDRHEVVDILKKVETEQ